MGGFRRPQESPIDILAAELAETVADALDDAGMALTGTNRVALISALGEALRRVGNERERAIRQSRIEQRATWVQENGLLNAADTAHRLGLTRRELETARELAIVAPVEVPDALCAMSAHFTAESWHYFRPDVMLTPADRTRIAHETLLTRAQAADRLGLPVPAFDRLRLEQGLTPVDQGHDRGTTRLTLYRQDAVDQLIAAPSGPGADAQREKCVEAADGPMARRRR